MFRRSEREVAQCCEGIKPFFFIPHLSVHVKSLCYFRSDMMDTNETSVPTLFKNIHLLLRYHANAKALSAACISSDGKYVMCATDFCDEGDSWAKSAEFLVFDVHCV